MSRSIPLLLAALVSTVLLAGCSPSPDAIRHTLHEHPELVMEVLAKHKVELADLVLAGMAEKREKARTAEMQKQLEHPLRPTVQADRPVLGNPEAAVLAVEYSDFLCPHCSKADDVMVELVAKHPGLVRLMFKHFPLHDGSLEAAAAFEILARQNPELAWRFKTELFHHQDRYAKEGVAYLKELAASLGAEMDSFSSGLKDQQILDRILADIKEAEAFGFKGTPMFVVGGVTVTGAVGLDEFERVVLLVKQHADETKCTTCVDGDSTAPAATKAATPAESPVP